MLYGTCVKKIKCRYERVVVPMQPRVQRLGGARRALPAPARVAPPARRTLALRLRVALEAAANKQPTAAFQLSRLPTYPTQNVRLKGRFC